MFKEVLTGIALVMTVSVTRAETNCRASCAGNADVQVNLEQKCMCLPDQECFEISIGKNGPSMTTQGVGKLDVAKGAKFQTKPYSSSSYDNDAIAMGIPENDAVGKWIHKTSECGPGGNKETLGCIAVPCDKWADVKENMGKTLAVCGGNAPMSRSRQSPRGNSISYPGYQQ